MGGCEPMRLRVVVDLTFDAADPVDCESLLRQCAAKLQGPGLPACRDVVLQESTTIGAGDSYSDWRWHRGEYDPAERLRNAKITFRPPRPGEHS